MFRPLALLRTIFWIWVALRLARTWVEPPPALGIFTPLRTVGTVMVVCGAAGAAPDGAPLAAFDAVLSAPDAALVARLAVDAAMLAAALTAGAGAVAAGFVAGELETGATTAGV